MFPRSLVRAKAETTIPYSPVVRPRFWTTKGKAGVVTPTLKPIMTMLRVNGHSLCRSMEVAESMRRSTNSDSVIVVVVVFVLDSRGARNLHSCRLSASMNSVRNRSMRAVVAVAVAVAIVAVAIVAVVVSISSLAILLPLLFANIMLFRLKKASS